MIVPVLQDAGESTTRFGQLVIAAASIADFVSVLLLSFLFSGESSGAGTKLLLIGFFVLAIAAVLLAVIGAEHSPPDLQDARAPAGHRARRSGSAEPSCSSSAWRCSPSSSGSS